jgi:hypothetical protein
MLGPDLVALAARAQPAPELGGLGEDSIGPDDAARLEAGGRYRVGLRARPQNRGRDRCSRDGEDDHQDAHLIALSLRGTSL